MISSAQRYNRIMTRKAALERARLCMLACDVTIQSLAGAIEQATASMREFTDALIQIQCESMVMLALAQMIVDRVGYEFPPYQVRSVMDGNVTYLDDMVRRWTEITK